MHQLLFNAFRFIYYFYEYSHLQERENYDGKHALEARICLVFKNKRVNIKRVGYVGNFLILKCREGQNILLQITPLVVQPRSLFFFVWARCICPASFPTFPASFPPSRTNRRR